MSWDGSGNVALPYDFSDDRDSGSPTNVIDPDRMDTQLAALVSAIEACLNRDGENALRANLLGGGYELTNIGAPMSATSAPRSRDVADNSLAYGGTTGGSANAHTASVSKLSSVATGTRLLCLAGFTNTGATTLAVNGGSATAVVAADGSSALAGGEITAGDFFEVAYDGTSWVLISAPNLAVENVSGITAFARTFLDDADAASVRTTLGLAIGTNVQAYNAKLGALSGLSASANTFPYFTGASAMAVGSVTTFGRSLIDDADASAARTTLGLGSLATANTINNDNWSGTDLAVANGGTGASDALGARTNLGLGALSLLGTDDSITWGGTHVFNGLTAMGNTFRIPLGTFASQSAAAAGAGAIRYITDGSSVSLTGSGFAKYFRLTAGGGSSAYLCVSDGGSWIVLDRFYDL
jgi:hypothetical protein